MNDVNMMWGIIALAAVVVAVVAVIALTRRAQAKRAALRERFGPEYERAKARFGENVAENILAARASRFDRTEIRALSAADRGRFGSQWTTIQAQFVDDPRGAVSRGSALIKEVMRARGYAADDGFERRAEDLSVANPAIVQHYRAAHALAHGGGAAAMSTEALRQAFVHYRVIFADLLQPSQTQHTMMQPAHAHAHAH